MSWFWLIIGGFIAGIINSLAGNGSAITLTLLLTFGLDASLANATNRVGVLLQTTTSVLSFKRSKRTALLMKDAIWFFIPTILGSVAGAFLAIGTPPQVLEYVIGIVMMVLLGTLILQPKKWLISTDSSKHKKTFSNWVLFFLIGVYGGFIQMGIGIMMLATLVLSAKYSLKDANIIKLVLAFILIIPSFIIYYISGDIQWIPGLALGLGAMAGAYVGTRYILYMKGANEYIRYLLIGVIIFALLKIFTPFF